ncbi:MAG: hypothetical protein Q8T08_26245 [Ignavibacteria bacterium]|nr:hypothetical protein [Ignavibacteria bacterium]
MRLKTRFKMQSDSRYFSELSAIERKALLKKIHASAKVKCLEPCDIENAMNSRVCDLLDLLDKNE